MRKSVKHIRISNTIDCIFHCIGYFENNIQLSTLRAANVREALLNDMGKEYSNRIGVAGYGETRLKNKVDPLSAENRRIEIRILWNGKEDK